MKNLSKDDIDYISKYEDYTYIPSSKIYFELELNEQPIIFCQNLTLNVKKNSILFNIGIFPKNQIIKKIFN